MKETCCTTFSNSVPSECGCRQTFPVVWATCKPHIWGMSTASLVVCSKGRMNYNSDSMIYSAGGTPYIQHMHALTVLQESSNASWTLIIVDLLMKLSVLARSSGLLTPHCRYASAPSIPSTFTLHALCVFPATSITASYKECNPPCGFTHSSVFHSLHVYTSNK